VGGCGSRKFKINVRQRADRYNVIGKPKSKKGKRTIPVPPPVLLVLKEWWLACPKGPLGLAFPNGKGRFETLGNLDTRGWQPAQVAAGVVKPNGKAKYSGLHALRHFFASWCINRVKDGGCELAPKRVQERMGHSKIGITMDRYSHLFPSTDDSAELAVAAAKYF
jgi:integrase